MKVRAVGQDKADHHGQEARRQAGLAAQWRLTGGLAATPVAPALPAAAPAPSQGPSPVSPGAPQRPERIAADGSVLEGPATKKLATPSLDPEPTAADPSS